MLSVKFLFRNCILICVVVLLLIILTVGCMSRPDGNTTQTRDYYRIVVFSDIHLPGKNLAAKEAALDDVNLWSDVDLVAVLGDICSDRGTSEEYESAKQFFRRLNKHFAPVTGNHDYIYEDELSPLNGQRIKASPQTRTAKLQLFKDTFNLSSVYYKIKAGPYLLLFLSPDDLFSPHLTRISSNQLNWVKDQLADNKETPTIIFFHGPLSNTFSGRNSTVGSSLFIAQPAEEFHKIIIDNPQVFLWVSGHIHLAPSHSSFNSDSNIYSGQVVNIHNPDMNGSSFISEKDGKVTTHNHVWTNSLYLYPDKVVVRTYDHTNRTWLSLYDRVIPRPL